MMTNSLKRLSVIMPILLCVSTAYAQKDFSGCMSLNNTSWAVSPQNNTSSALFFQINSVEAALGWSNLYVLRGVLNNSQIVEGRCYEYWGPYSVYIDFYTVSSSRFNPFAQTQVPAVIGTNQIPAIMKKSK